jgi:hypothetical protein
MSATSGTGTAYPTGAPAFNPGNRVLNDVVFYIGSTVRYILHMHVVLENCYNVYANGKFTMGTFKSTLLS